MVRPVDRSSAPQGGFPPSRPSPEMKKLTANVTKAAGPAFSELNKEYSKFKPF